MQTIIVQPAGLEGEVKVMPPLSLKNIRAMVLMHQVATEDEVDHVVNALYKIARDPTTYVFDPRIVQASATKPTAG